MQYFQLFVKQTYWLLVPKI